MCRRPAQRIRSYVGVNPVIKQIKQLVLDDLLTLAVPSFAMELQLDQGQSAQ